MKRQQGTPRAGIPNGEEEVLVALGAGGRVRTACPIGEEPHRGQRTSFLRRGGAELGVSPALTDGEVGRLFLGDSAVLQQQGSDGLVADEADGRATRAPQTPARDPPPRRPTSASSVRK